MKRGGSAAYALRSAIAVLAGLVAGLLLLPGLAVAQPAGPTQLAAADMALLNGVRLAGLWEMPAGQMAADKGSRERVREIGAEISKQHVELDELVVVAANKLGVQLPTEPNADQKKWLGEMQGASGQRFDRIFVDRLRAAHGVIFPVIGAVRAGTRNPVVRQLAEDANRFVMTHMTLLESTGLVRYQDLPPAALPAPPQSGSFLAAAQANPVPGNDLSPVVIWVLLLAALAVGIAATFRVLRPRRVDLRR
jgi:predicted outer membrane protein